MSCSCGIGRLAPSQRLSEIRIATVADRAYAQPHEAHAKKSTAEHTGALRKIPHPDTERISAFANQANLKPSSSGTSMPKKV